MSNVMLSDSRLHKAAKIKSYAVVVADVTFSEFLNPLQ